jgi:hypothetical protein
MSNINNIHKNPLSNLIRLPISQGDAKIWEDN